MKHRFILFLLIGIDAFILFYQISDLSISRGEARLLYGDFSPLQALVKTSLFFFGHNDYGLRFVMILFHVLSTILLFLISKRYIKSYRNRLWLILMFVMLPGVVSSALIVNSAGFILFGLLLFIYLSQKVSLKYLLVFLLLLSVADRGFLYLFMALSIYYIFQKNKYLVLYSLSLAILNVTLYGIDVGGIPTGHFLDAIGVYSAILTPIIFIYLFYNLYRRYLTNKVDMLWYISATPFIYSLILSFRQQVSLELYAPYLIVSLPLAAQTFISSYRVRLKMFRSAYKTAFILSFIFLFLNSAVVLFNKELYLLLDKPKHHFAYDMHIAKELANKLKEMDINCIGTDEDMQERLKFYGLPKCQKFQLKESKKNPDVTISYKNKILYSASVTKLNNK